MSTLSAKAHFKRVARAGSFACFQRAMGPTPIKNIAGAISGTKTAACASWRPFTIAGASFSHPATKVKRGMGDSAPCPALLPAVNDS